MGAHRQPGTPIIRVELATDPNWRRLRNQRVVFGATQILDTKIEGQKRSRNNLDHVALIVLTVSVVAIVRRWRTIQRARESQVTNRNLIRVPMT